MSDAIPQDNSAAYALFALGMLTAESREAKSLERYNSTLHVTTDETTQDKATVRPSK